VRELLYNAARHYKRGRALAERGDLRGAMAAYQEALRDLHAVKPQRLRDVLLAQVHLSRYQVARQLEPEHAASDLRLGYSYARTTKEPAVRELAEELWRAYQRERQTAGKVVVR
jgi:tetratricopeptide (TPR) repeat protein